VKTLRIVIEFSAKKVPVSSNFLFLSFIKEALNNTDPEYFKKLFFYGENSNKITKCYTYAVLHRGYKLEGDEFVASENSIIQLLVSSPDQEFIVNLYNGILGLEEFRYKTYTLVRKNIRMVKEKTISSPDAVFTTLSPICVKNKHGRYLDLEDPEFKKELNYLADLILKNYRGFGLKRELEFYPLGMKKRVVKLHEKFLGDKIFYVNSFVGDFKLSGDVEDLNLLYKLGLSFRRSEGFGLIEVVG